VAARRGRDGRHGRGHRLPRASLEETERAVFELPGETTRALAWALLADEAGDLERAREYAERGATHLDVAVSAIDELELNQG
jgi:hypothetical protein